MNRSTPASHAEDPELRVLESVEECRRSVALQRAVWGPGYEDVVPASMIRATLKVGGLLAGAFSGDGGDAELVGFVYGVTGLQKGRPVHWSHMLGVLPSHRSRGIGRRLKDFQRSWVLEREITEIQWTFDPLVSGNAHFNLTLLGAEVTGYEVDMYGDTGSALHSFGTDRFVARWDLTTAGRPRAPAPAGPDPEAAALLNPPCDAERPEIRMPPPEPDAPSRVRIRIPRDVLAIQERDPVRARRWRESTRLAFTAALEAGFRVTGFVRIPGADECFYLLERDHCGPG